MLILFKRLLEEPELLDKFTPEEHIMIEGLFEYVEGRLSPFKKEMEEIERAEDEAGGKLQSFVVIHFPAPGISIYGYTDEMRDKMTASFSQMDVDPMWQGIVEKLRTFLN
jgi:hypothetical protein